MKICPIAIVAGCPKCPVFNVCPAKSTLGGYVAPTKKDAADSKSAPSRK